jgi:hypothetical protein
LLRSETDLSGVEEPSNLPLLEDQAILGSTIPAQWTRPLVSGAPGPCGCGCALTDDTTLGFEFDAFCREVVGRALDPWQRWLAIHGLEVLPDGRPRFRQLLVLVARQNGKTELLVLLSLFWLYSLEVGLVLGTSTKLDYSRESWLKAVALVKGVPDLWNETGQIRNANGEQELPTVSGCRYKIAAANDEGGRSLTVARLIEDEIRQHRTWDAHEAAENAGNAVPDFQAWAISNAGDSRSVVLNSFQDQGLDFIRTGVGDYRLGYFGWVAPDDADPTDPQYLAMANPNLGRRIDIDALIGKARRAKKAGGEQLIKFRTEVMCTRVKSMEPLKITLDELSDCVDPNSRLIGRPLFAVDVELDRSAAVIVAGGYRDDGLMHVKVLDYRAGTGWVMDRIRQLEERWEPIGWIVNDSGPAGALIPGMENLEDDNGDLLNGRYGVKVIPVSMGAMGNACGHLQDITARQGWRYPGPNTEGLDYVADALEGSGTRTLGDRWAWDRRGETGIAPLVAVTEVLWGLMTVPRPAVPWFGSS